MADFNVVEVDADPFSIDRDKIVGVTFAQTGVAATTYYALIDLDGASYKHDVSGTVVKVAQATGQALKSNVGAKWTIQLAVVLAINATDANLAILPGVSVSLRDTSRFGTDEQVVRFFPHMLDLTVSGGDLDKIANGIKETGVTAVNTASTLPDVFGVSVVPAVGDVLARVKLISGAGTLDFAISAQYFTE